jgi:FtsP/CotA-like multicopper oxidase with cupredoxin domain
MLRLGLAGGGAVAATPLLGRLTRSPDGVTLQSSSGSSGDIPDPPSFPHFSQELKVPRVLTGTTRNGRTAYRVTQAPTALQILPAPFPKTTLWTFEGSFPGPTIRQQRGGPLTFVDNTNHLPKGNPYSTHLHGSPTQPFYDGHPDILVGVGATKRYYYPNNESVRTLWYHDHAIHQTADHVYRGLAGFFLHEPSAAEAARAPFNELPRGAYDVPLLLNDLQYTPQGQLFFDDHGEDSLFGNVQLVNGVPWPFMRVDPTMYRFRILVATVSRGFNFRLSNGMPFTVIGNDAGLIPNKVSVTSFRQGMAERYEVVIDFSSLAGQSVTLLSTAADDQMRDVMRFVLGTNRDVPRFSVPTELAEPDFPSAADVVNTRNFRFERSGGLWVINGLPWDNRVVATVRANTTERWFFENKSGGWFHPVHVHLVDFKIVSRNGRPAFPYESGLKDVVYVGPNERTELLMHFRQALEVDEAPHAPVLGKYVMHCHNLVHEDHDMMSEFDNRGRAGADAHGTQTMGTPRKMPPSMMVQWELRA